MGRLEDSMDIVALIDHVLQQALDGHCQAESPPRLAAAMRHAVFPGGARIRPRLCLAVAMACDDDQPALSQAAAAAIELLHCASLVHDDLPCFDDAPLRRGQASVHVAFGERLAVLAGDALIVLAFQLVAEAASGAPVRAATLLRTLARGVGMPSGIVAGQAWECEPQVALRDYQRAKTGALFAAATMAGAQAAGAAAEPWRALGECLGEAYQVADDIRDVVSDPAALGKPVGQDQALGRPSWVSDWGLVASVKRFQELVDRAIASVPECRGQGALQALVRMEAERLVPQALRSDLVREAA
jgi:geranylgeranyl diphosphate synthase type II